jgi:hypothetical protein
MPSGPRSDKLVNVLAREHKSRFVPYCNMTTHEGEGSDTSCPKMAESLTKKWHGGRKKTCTIGDSSGKSYLPGGQHPTVIEYTVDVDEAIERLERSKGGLYGEINSTDKMSRCMKEMENIHERLGATNRFGWLLEELYKVAMVDGIVPMENEALMSRRIYVAWANVRNSFKRGDIVEFNLYLCQLLYLVRTRDSGCSRIGIETKRQEEGEIMMCFTMVKICFRHTTKLKST